MPPILSRLFIILLFSALACYLVFAPSTQIGPPGSPLYGTPLAEIVVQSTNHTYTSRPASFGPPAEEYDIEEQVLVSIHPLSACSTVDEDIKGKIVMVQRGDCSFIDKVRNLQTAGAIAVVVGDNMNGGLITMFGRDEGTMSDWSLFNTLLLIILSPLITLFAVYCLLLVRRRAQDRRDRAPKSVVNSLPKRTYRQKELKVRNETTGEIEEAQSDTSSEYFAECIVCLERYQDGDKLTMLPCNHEFHQACITPWLLKRKRFCPICRVDVSSEQKPSRQRRASASSTEIETEQGERTPLLDRRDSGRFEGGSTSRPGLTSTPSSPIEAEDHESRRANVERLA